MKNLLIKPRLNCLNILKCNKLSNSIIAFVSVKSRWQILLAYSVIFIVIFLCVLPFECQTWVYSLYFRSKHYEKIAEDILKHKNENRWQEANNYLDQLNKAISKEWHQRQLQSNLDVLVIVKTMDRTATNDNPSTGYLTQTVTALDREIRQVSSNFQIGYVTCNIDMHPKFYNEAHLIDKYFVSIVKNVNYTSSDLIVHKRETEKQDYAFCLKKSTEFRASYVLMIEDDTAPYENVFMYLQDVIKNRLERRLVRGNYITANEWAFVKLYYPERWAGYSREVPSICELVGIGALYGTFCAFVGYLVDRHKLLRTHMFLGFCFGVVLAAALGRQHLMQLRRLSPKLLMMTEAPGCCTPAVLYSASRVHSILNYLSNVTCSENYGVDIALDDYAEKLSLKKYLIQPNLFHHRGVYSTLTKPKNYAEFLFDA